jgi:hypothetical protein
MITEIGGTPMTTGSSTLGKWVAGAGVAAVIVATAAIWNAANAWEDAPPRLPRTRPPIEPAPANRAAPPAPSVPLQPELVPTYNPRVSGPPNSLSNHHALWWGGRRSDDPASNPKVLAYLKKEGITDPERANDLFPYQWQVDELDELSPSTP